MFPLLLHGHAKLYDLLDFSGCSSKTGLFGTWLACMSNMLWTADEKRTFRVKFVSLCVSTWKSSLEHLVLAFVSSSMSCRPAIYRSGFKCLKCNKSFSSKDAYLDLTITSGTKEYNEFKPTRTELFRYDSKCFPFASVLT